MEGINFSVEWDNMDNRVSSIWIKIGGKGKQSLLIGGMYREHFNIRQGWPNNSRDPAQQ